MIKRIVNTIAAVLIVVFVNAQKSNNSLSKLEGKIIDTIRQIEKLKLKSLLVINNSNGKRRLKYMTWT